MTSSAPNISRVTSGHVEKNSLHVDSVRSRVTISATRAFTAKWLLPRLPDFRSTHPEIDLQLHAADDAIDLRSDAVDIAIRYGARLGSVTVQPA